MVAANAVQPAADSRPIVWSWLWTEDRDGAPVAKVYFRYYDSNEVVRYKKLKAGYDDGAVWIEPLGRSDTNPSVSDMETLLAELEADYAELPTQYKVERASEVNL